ncbi:hypothetical protein MUK42_06289 [Musa troglodytarum]|uniref:Uncharacterized protein n=1 Tax=Musa troglodytarum TaxID=320322 RepID=A0A9E7KFG7_9LILI|nr:hypothetical protein MUK42_06289 [Musa troglodytarum]
MALRFYDLADPLVFSCFLRISPPGYLRHSIPAVVLALSRLLFGLVARRLGFDVSGLSPWQTVTGARLVVISSTAAVLAAGSTREKALSGAIVAFEGLDLLKNLDHFILAIELHEKASFVHAFRCRSFVNHKVYRSRSKIPYQQSTVFSLLPSLFCSFVNCLSHNTILKLLA